MCAFFLIGGTRRLPLECVYVCKTEIEDESDWIQFELMLSICGEKEELDWKTNINIHTRMNRQIERTQIVYPQSTSSQTNNSQTYNKGWRRIHQYYTNIDFAFKKEDSYTHRHTHAKRYLPGSVDNGLIIIIIITHQRQPIKAHISFEYTWI